MGVYKELSYSCENTSIIMNSNVHKELSITPLTFKSYINVNCRYLIEDILKIEDEYEYNLSYILKDSLLLCFKKQIKKPRFKVKKSVIELYSEKYNYNIFIKSYYL